MITRSPVAISPAAAQLQRLAKQIKASAKSAAAAPGMRRAILIVIIRTELIGMPTRQVQRMLLV